ncbi:MAG: hypothetical protein MUC97_00165 [Bernardetiaceae bacterium]|jgi:hypothetical protein|nr:hypothetical protein [Bernardetiaceae bacterium]
MKNLAILLVSIGLIIAAQKLWQPSAGARPPRLELGQNGEARPLADSLPEPASGVKYLKAQPPRVLPTQFE